MKPLLLFLLILIPLVAAAGIFLGALACGARTMRAMLQASVAMAASR